jgi:response regulator of citrate/malate metabolism
MASNKQARGSIETSELQARALEWLDELANTTDTQPPGWYTAKELSSILGLSVSSAKRYLDEWVKNDLCKARYLRTGRSSGRIYGDFIPAIESRLKSLTSRS